ncbi:SURF1 family protein [Pseudoclavibacter chungangensis]|uniref:SURF1-like protein n=1 Tax=Pseudoclavibacter chungangensis TaxID=587635 RepID=A0A7J5C136_9MICO|nr:SURF1 family cytochrome oxidase biogenesis protein [Pseudoclavibacter chungangensis]KAB1662344.1 SURF1 family protein [Pseudoclavibacter chungangensis]NYJ65555.1 hypothetical protein [Pseudoclavibacter chungangensis]
MLRVLARPKWIGALVLALVVASLFAWLGKWQLDSAIRSVQGEDVPAASQPALGLGELATPQEGLYDASIGRAVTFEGVVDPRDFDVVHNRLQGEALGVWVVGHVLVTDDGTREYVIGDASAAAPGLAVVVGWAPDEATGRAVVERLAAETPSLEEGEVQSFAGRLEYGQAPERPRGESADDAVVTMAPAQLVNRWAEHRTPAYGSYVILEKATGLASDATSAIEPVQFGSSQANPQFNLLNVFYAIEWAVFAIFAIFIWWRLARDEYGRELAAAGTAEDALALEIRREKLRALAARRREQDAEQAGPAQPPADGS